jgi:hypothetical protein
MVLNNKTITSNKSVQFSQQIDRPPGQLFVCVGVLDQPSNKVGTLELPLTIGKSR